MSRSYQNEPSGIFSGSSSIRLTVGRLMWSASAISPFCNPLLILMIRKTFLACSSRCCCLVRHTCGTLIPPLVVLAWIFSGTLHALVLLFACTAGYFSHPTFSSAKNLLIKYCCPLPVTFVVLLILTEPSGLLTVDSFTSNNPSSIDF